MFFFSFFSVRTLSVKLQGKNRPLSANNSYDLHCEIVGSRPTPTVTWWKGSQLMRGHQETVIIKNTFLNCSQCCQLDMNIKSYRVDMSDNDDNASKCICVLLLN